MRVYYDGACPLCRREIAFYQRRAGDAPIEWVDVSSVDGDAVEPDLTVRAAMGRFHIRNATGELVSGGAAFAALWVAIPGWKPLGRVMQTPPFSWIVRVAYRVFLPLRPYLQRIVRRPARSG